MFQVNHRCILWIIYHRELKVQIDVENEGNKSIGIPEKEENLGRT